MYFTMIVWLFGDSGIGKKTLIRNITAFSSEYEKNKQLRELFGFEKKDIILPVIIQNKQNKKRLEVFKELYRNDSKQISHIIHGQYYDFGERVLNQLKTLKNFNSISKCYYLIPSEEDFILRREKRKLNSNYSSFLKKSESDIKILKQYFNKVKKIQI